VLARGCRTLIAQYRRDLEAQLQRREVGQEIERLRETYPVFEKYASVEDLAALVRPGNRAYADKDAVLGALLVEIKRDAATEQGPRLFPLLNVMFWDSLCNVFWRKVRSCPDADDLFTRVRADFFQVAVTYPLDRRPRKININLYWDTWKKVTAWQREEANYRDRHKDFEQTDYCNRHASPKHNAIFHKRQKQPEPTVRFCTELADLQESEVFPDQAEEHLIDLVYRKVIDENQYDLLLETEVYKRMTEKEWAKAHGVKYTTARSWRHRAEKAIQEYEKSARERREQETLD
jgi:hypothetical protein